MFPCFFGGFLSTLVSSIASALISRGNVIFAQRRWEAAAVDYRQAYNIYRAQLGENHPRVGRVGFNLASALRSSGQCDLALPLYDEALRIARLHYAEDHPSVIAPRSQRSLCNAPEASG